MPNKVSDDGPQMIGSRTAAEVGQLHRDEAAGRKAQSERSGSIRNAGTMDPFLGEATKRPGGLPGPFLAIVRFMSEADQPALARQRSSVRGPGEVTPINTKDTQPCRTSNVKLIA